MTMIEFYSPSYKRPDAVITQQYLPFCTYVVAESEADAYIAAGNKVIAVPDEAQGSAARIRNWILDNVAKGKRIVMLDDDLAYIGRWNMQKALRLEADEVMEFCEMAFDLVDELGVKLWGMNLLPDKGAYREYTPFSFKSMVLGPFQAFNGLDLRYDEKLPLKEDYDLSLQVLQKYGQTFRFNMYFYSCKQHTNVGGCADMRTLEREKDQFLRLQRKWGSTIIQRDKMAKGYDLNPVIKVPIGGI